MNIDEYFHKLEEQVNTNYAIAGEARKIGVDPSSVVDVPIARSLAERVLGLVSVLYPQIQNPKIVERILELEKQYGSLNPAVALTIAEEIAKEKYCTFKDKLQAMEAGIRAALGYLTLGYVSSPIEGFIQLKVCKRADGKEYLAPYYSGPIRSAGGTEAAFSLVVIDYLREMFGYEKYDPTEDEIKRGIHECYEYHDKITNLQYLPSEQEIEFLMRYLPIQLTGDPSEDREVLNYKDLPRIETNMLRSGFCLVLGEGLAQKAPKILARVIKLREKGFKLTDWPFLDEFVKLQKKIKEGKTGGNRGGATYIQDLVAGRPVYAHPSRSGAFRLRYGRARNTGYSTLALSPATMGASDGSIAIGTQLKIEQPTKGCTVASCDTIDGPIVKFRDGSVRRILTYEEGRTQYKDIEEIIYLGDLLVPYGDFLNRNHALEKPGYVEQYWLEELINKGGASELNISFEKALELSKQFGVSLHPSYIYYWREIEKEAFLALVDWVVHGRISEEKLILPYTAQDRQRFAKGKRALEIIGCNHIVAIEDVVLDSTNSRAFLFNLGMDIGDFKKEIEESIVKIKGSTGEKVLDILKDVAKLEIRDKSGTFIGARMGRPEKAKLRKLTGSPHVLFPVGDEGGRLRSFQEAIEKGKVVSEFPIYYCASCKKETIYSQCENCKGKCEKKSYCHKCQKTMDGKCEEHQTQSDYKEMDLDIRHYFDDALKKIGIRLEEIPVVVKGVRGTSSADHSCEYLAKGLLRAKHNLNVNKDGTIRYDMTEMPITQFKPKEIGTDVEKLRELGYEKDIYGKDLENEEQILEIFPHDIILPSCPETPDEKADDVLMNVSKFIDDELEKIYGQPRHFNAKNRRDLIGSLLGCMSPHTSAVALGRLIGFSNIQAMLCSPYVHAAMRRDCLGHDNYVSLYENGQWKIEKIGEFVEKINPKKKADLYGTLKEKVEGIKTWTNLGESKVSEVTKHSPRKLIRLVLEDGRNLDLTENHRVYLKGKKEKIAGELKVGEQLMIDYFKEIQEEDISELFLPEIFKNRDDVSIRNISSFLEKFEKLSKHDNFAFRDSFPIKIVQNLLKKHGKDLRDLPSEATISIKRDKIEIPIRIRLSNELLEAIGLYISEGFSRKNISKKGFYQLSISGNEEIKSFIKKVFENHFGLKPSWENEDSVTYSSRIVYEIFTEYLGCGSKAREKRIPSLFLNLKKEKIAALLRGYYEGDGSVSTTDIRVACDSVSEGLKYDLSFVFSRFGIYTKFYEYEKEPGPIVKEFYIKKKRKIPKFKITKIIIPSNFVYKFKQIGFISERKNKILDEICLRKPYGMKIEHDKNYVYPKIKRIDEIGEKESYCLNVSKEHNFFANDLLVHNCDGDEAAIMFLMDLLLNFSRRFIPSHRGGTQDAPLVLNIKIKANEVDDMIFDLDVGTKIPLELYEAAELHKMPGEIKMPQIKGRLGTGNEFTNIGYSYEVGDLNCGALCSTYKTLPTMQDKLDMMMKLCEKIRAVDIEDVARLVVERHFIRDTRGNLRKFSMQEFRCVGCNSKYRRPPLTGKCKCGGRLIFTIAEGSVLKYMQPALNLVRKYGSSAYLLESLELNEMYIQSIFGKEKEKQMTLL